jgi:hypothetical protein
MEPDASPPAKEGTAARARATLKMTRACSAAKKGHEKLTHLPTKLYLIYTLQFGLSLKPSHFPSLELLILLMSRLAVRSHPVSFVLFVLHLC